MWLYVTTREVGRTKGSVQTVTENYKQHRRVVSAVIGVIRLSSNRDVVCKNLLYFFCKKIAKM